MTSGRYRAERMMTFVDNPFENTASTLASALDDAPRWPECIVVVFSSGTPCDWE